MSSEYKTLRKQCADCTGLKSGTRSSQDPHQYLVAGSKDPANPRHMHYHCLVCRTELKKVVDGYNTLWI